MSSITKSLSINMRTAIGLLEVLLVAIILAFIITIINGTIEIQLLALAFVTPQIILILVFIYYDRKKKVWSYAGATILGAADIILRVSVSTQPHLEVGVGGLPSGVTTFYIVLAALVVLKNYESFLELRN